MTTGKPSGRRPGVPRFLSVADVAEILGASEKTVRRLIDAGEVPVHRFGRLVRVSAADLDAFIARSRRN